VEDSLIGIN